jgi:hypothetical protein
MYKSLIAGSLLIMSMLVCLYLSDYGGESIPLDDDDSAGDDDDSGKYDRLPPVPKD